MKYLNLLKIIEIVISSLICIWILLSLLFVWYSSPERLHYKKGSKEYTFIQLSLAQAAIFGTETPPLGTTFRRVIRIQKRIDMKNCEQNTVYQKNMQQMEAVIEEKLFLGLGKTRYRLSSCAGIKSL